MKPEYKLKDSGVLYEFIGSKKTAGSPGISLLFKAAEKIKKTNALDIKISNSVNTYVVTIRSGNTNYHEPLITSESKQLKKALFNSIVKFIKNGK